MVSFETVSDQAGGNDGQGEEQPSPDLENLVQAFCNPTLLPTPDASILQPPSGGTPDTTGLNEILSKISGPAGGKSDQPKEVPPVDESSVLIDVSETLPSHDTIQTFLSSPGCGAVSTFVGITRDNFAGKKVTHLSYEGYTPMAIKELKSLCRDAKATYPTVDKLVAVHILGDCPVGEASVVVGCSSPHRREAIRCTEFLIDELKGRVPIWKKEVYEGDEGSVWKENLEWHEGRRRRVMVKEQIS